MNVSHSLRSCQERRLIRITVQVVVHVVVLQHCLDDSGMLPLVLHGVEVLGELCKCGGTRCTKGQHAHLHHLQILREAVSPKESLCTSILFPHEDLVEHLLYVAGDCEFPSPEPHEDVHKGLR